MGKVIVIFLALTIIASTAILFPDTQHYYAVLYLLLLFLLTAVPVIILLKKGISIPTAFVIFPTLLVSLDTFFLRKGLFNIFAYLDDSLFYKASLDSVKKAMILVLIGNLALWLGFFWPVSKRIARRLENKILKWTSFHVRPRMWLIWIAFFIGIAVRIYLVKAGIGGYFSERSLREDALPYIQFMFLLENLSTLSLVTYFCIQLQKQQRPKWVTFGVMLFLEIITIIFVGFKGQVFIRFFYLAVAYTFLTKKFSKKLILSGIIALIFITPINLEVRSQFLEGKIGIGNIKEIQGAFYQAGRQQFHSEGILGTIASSYETIIRYSAQLESLSMVIGYEDSIGTGFYGKSYLHIFIWAIPRAIWPSKPKVDAEWVAAEVYGMGRPAPTSSPQTVPGDLYVNFGIFGVVIGFFLFGAIQRIVSTGLLLKIQSLRFIPAVPFLIFWLAQPQSDFGPSIGAMIKFTIYNLLICTLMFPKVKDIGNLRK